MIDKQHLILDEGRDTISLHPTYFAELQLYPDQNMAAAYFANVLEPAEFYSKDVFRALFDRYAR